LLFDFGLFAQAEREFARASELLPRHVPLRSARALALANGGRPADARRVLEESAARNPESQAARSALESFRKANPDTAR
jgi:predicted Zn-dependent protease